MTGGGEGDVRVWELRSRELVSHLKASARGPGASKVGGGVNHDENNSANATTNAMRKKRPTGAESRIPSNGLATR